MFTLRRAAIRNRLLVVFVVDFQYGRKAMYFSELVLNK